MKAFSADATRRRRPSIRLLRVVGAVAVAAALIASSASEAAATAKGDLEDLIDASDAVILAKVEKVQKSVMQGRKTALVRVLERISGDDCKPYKKVYVSFADDKKGRILVKGRKYILCLKSDRGKYEWQVGEYMPVLEGKGIVKYDEKKADLAKKLIRGDFVCLECSMKLLQEELRELAGKKEKGPAKKTKCASCGRPIEKGFKYCKSCALKKRICRVCGRPHEPDFEEPDEEGQTVQVHREDIEELEEVLMRDEPMKTVDRNSGKLIVKPYTFLRVKGVEAPDPRKPGKSFILVKGPARSMTMEDNGETFIAVEVEKEGRVLILFMKRDSRETGFYTDRIVEIECRKEDSGSEGKEKNSPVK